MMKMKEWMTTPITWGTYLKFGGICSLIGLAISGITYAIIFKDDIKKWLKSKKNTYHKVED